MGIISSSIFTGHMVTVSNTTFSTLEEHISAGDKTIYLMLEGTSYTIWSRPQG